jgi:2-polyprenyl-3-methyl-5-hydroxy-6-metoxy-1,4-benzoquinol methylase
MKESDIRRRDAHNRYLELVRRDAERLASDCSSFSDIGCPACGSGSHRTAFVKFGFTYSECGSCDTLFVNPRPSFDALVQLYADSPSTKYWVEQFFAPVAEARREKIFRPRAEYVTTRLPQLRNARVGDVGAGFGLFLEELRRLWPEARAVAIEPSVEMAAILRQKGIPVVERMLEAVDPGEHQFDLLTAFELFEHLHDPAAFLGAVRSLLSPGGYLLLTTLNGLGFDIQVHWERSKSVSPPHHLNFVNPESMARLLERTGFEIVEVTTPGELDWDIVEGALRNEDTDPGRFFRTVCRYGTAEAKRDLQAWVRNHRFSSHLRAVARRPA